MWALKAAAELLQKSCWTYRAQKLLFLHLFFSQAKQAADAGDIEETHGNTSSYCQNWKCFAVDYMCGSEYFSLY